MASRSRVSCPLPLPAARALRRTRRKVSFGKASTSAGSQFRLTVPAGCGAARKWPHAPGGNPGRDPSFVGSARFLCVGRPPVLRALRGTMPIFLRLSRAIDWVNGQFAVLANWLVLLACLISAGNAASRYLFSESSNGWLEIQWYMFAGMVLLGAPYTLRMNEHV